MSPQHRLDSLAAGAACFDQREGLGQQTPDKYDPLVCIIQNLFLGAEGLEDISEPVVIRQNSDFNIFRLIQRSLKQEYRVSGEKFWGIVRNINTSGEMSKDIWRPRFQGSQLKCLGAVRYPRTAKEWNRLSTELVSVGYALLPEITPAQFIQQIQSFVDNLGSLWRSDRRYKYKRQRDREVDPENDVSGGKRRHEDEFHSDPRAVHWRKRTAFVPGTTSLAKERNQEANAESQPSEPEQRHSESGAPSQTTSQPLDQGKVIASLMVGGKEFITTVGTLNSVPNSFFSKLVKFSDGASEFFVDRSPKMFEYILSYLRATRYGEPPDMLSLPDSIHELKMLRRESCFYRLPDLTCLIENRIDEKRSPRIDILVLETPRVHSEQALTKELQILSNKANMMMKSSNASSDMMEILSHNVQVFDEGHESNQWARVILTMQEAHK